MGIKTTLRRVNKTFYFEGKPVHFSLAKRFFNSLKCVLFTSKHVDLFVTGITDFYLMRQPKKYYDYYVNFFPFSILSFSADRNR